VRTLSNLKPPKTADPFEGRVARRRGAVEAAMEREIGRLDRARERVRDVDPEVLVAAVDCLGSPERAALWLSSPQILLSEATPLDLSGTPEGRERVLRLLARLVRGMFD
jgi:uncharacterized protein (DUF2384 family)